MYKRHDISISQRTLPRSAGLNLASSRLGPEDALIITCLTEESYSYRTRVALKSIMYFIFLIVLVLFQRIVVAR